MVCYYLGEHLIAPRTQENKFDVLGDGSGPWITGKYKTCNFVGIALSSFGSMDTWTGRVGLIYFPRIIPDSGLMVTDAKQGLCWTDPNWKFISFRAECG